MLKNVLHTVHVLPLKIVNIKVHMLMLGNSIDALCTCHWLIFSNALHRECRFTSRMDDKSDLQENSVYFIIFKGGGRLSLALFRGMMLFCSTAVMNIHRNRCRQKLSRCRPGSGLEPGSDGNKLNCFLHLKSIFAIKFVLNEILPFFNLISYPKWKRLRSNSNEIKPSGAISI